MEQQIRAVLFDMDGLMFDTERLGDEVWRAVAGKYGVTMTPEDVSLLRGAQLRKRPPCIFGTLRRRVPLR